MGIFSRKFGKSKDKNKLIFYEQKGKKSKLRMEEGCKSQRIHERCIIINKIIYQKKEVATY